MSDVIVEFVNVMLPSTPLALVDGTVEFGKSDVGRAIRTTPRIDTKPATCCDRVKGSWITTQHAKQATVGARKDMTVASAMGRYCSES